MADKDLKINLTVNAAQGVAAVGKQSQAFAELRQQVDIAQVSLGRLSVAIVAGQAAFAALGVVIQGVFSRLPGALLDGALAAEKMQKAFVALEGSLDGARQQIAFVRDEAQRLGVPLAEASGAWLKLAAAARGTTLEGEDARRIFSSVAGAASTLGLSAAETSGALLAISQMMSKGTVQAEELRGQLGERIPGAFQIAARAMGVSTQALGEMLERGEVLASDFLPKFAAQLAKEIPASIDGTQNAINRLGNAAEEWKRLTGSALAVALDGFFKLKQQAGDLGGDGQIVEWARKSAIGIAMLVDALREVVMLVPNVLKTVGESIAVVARDIKFTFDVAAAVVTEGVGQRGRDAMRRALEERNAFVAAANEDLENRWAPKRMAEHVDEFFADLGKQQAASAAKASALFDAELTKEQQKTIDTLLSKEEKLAAEYKAHAVNLYAALTSGALAIDRYNEQRKKLELWYQEHRSKIAKTSIVTRLPTLIESFDAELAALRAGLKTAEDVLEASFRARLVNEEAYWQAKGEMQRRALDLEAQDLQRQMADQQRLIAKLEKVSPKDANQRQEIAERITQAKNRLAELQIKLNGIDGRRMVVDLEVTSNLDRVRRELEDLKASLRERIAEATGEMTPEMRRAAIERDNRETLAKMKDDAEGEAMVKRFIDIEAAKRDMAALEAEWRQVTERMRNAQEAVQTQQQAGLITDAQARQLLVGAQREAAAEMARLLPALDKAAQALGPDAVVRVAAFRNELERTRLVTDDLASLWNGIGNSFGNALNGMVTGAQTWRDAMTGLFRQVADAFLKNIVIEPFQKWVAMQAKMLAMKLGFIQQENEVDRVSSTEKVATKAQETEAIVTMNAAQAGSGAAESQAAIPVVGPGLALAAMAAMVAAVMALLSKVKKYAAGGLVSGPGTSTSDSIPARLSAGEYVIRADAVRRVGVAFLDTINGLRMPPPVIDGRLAFAAGGLVPAAPPAGAPAQVNNAIRIVNAVDPGVTHDHMQTPAGERVILNIIGRNARAVRAALQG